MGISNSKRFIYFVIPKTGSATIRNAIDKYRDITHPTAIFSEHVTIERFLTSNYAHLFEQYYKFSFVRNPYDRLYSGFLQDSFGVATMPHWRSAKGQIFAEIGTNFNRYIEDYVTRADIFNDPFWVHFCPMHAFTHRNGELVLDWLGKAESLEVDFRGLAKRLDLDIGPLESRNVRGETANSNLKYMHHYNARSIEIVNSIYRNDFMYFGYDMFDPAP